MPWHNQITTKGDQPVIATSGRASSKPGRASYVVSDRDGSQSL